MLKWTNYEMIEWFNRLTNNIFNYIDKNKINKAIILIGESGNKDALIWLIIMLIYHQKKKEFINFSIH